MDVKKEEIAEVCKRLDSKEFEKIKEWVFRGKGNIIFTGLPGRGKTYSAKAVMHFFSHKDSKNLFIPESEQRFINIPELNQQWLAGFQSCSENYNKLKIFQSCLLLIIDDIGIKKPSDAFLEYLYCIINERRNNENLRTIITTNESSQELNSTLGPRIVSRLATPRVIKYTGPDLRLGF